MGINDPSPGGRSARFARDAELGDALRRAAGGSGEVIVLDDLGALDRVAERAAEVGLHVLTARGVERDREVAFGVARQLFGPALERLGERERGSVLSGAASLAAPALDDDHAPGAGELSLIHGLYWLTSNLADRRPLALLVADAQWVDDPSLRLFAYLAGRIDELPVALVVAGAGVRL